MYFSKTLIKNYEKGNTKADKENKYKLSISDRVYHIETDNDDNTENNQWQNNLIQNLGADITGYHCMINIGLGLQGLEFLELINGLIPTPLSPLLKLSTSTPIF